MTSTWLNPDGDGTGGAVLKHLKPDQASDAGARANLRSACVSAAEDQLGSSISSAVKGVTGTRDRFGLVGRIAQPMGLDVSRQLDRFR
jgi:hypothetical protein